MKKLKVVFSLFLVLLFWHKAETAEQEGPSLRVLVAKEARGVLLEAKGGYKILHRASQRVLSYGTSGKRFVAHALSNGLRWGEEFPGIYAISVLPTESKTTFFVDGMQYQGAIHVYATTKGLVNIVNDVPIEEFVRSTLSLKLLSPITHEAAAAMAIAARTNAFSHIFYRKDSKVLWDVVAKEVGYLGVGVTLRHNGVEQAVDGTRYIVLEDRAGVPMQNVNLDLSDAEKLAAKGLDAKRILRSSVAQGEIGMINTPWANRSEQR